MGQGPDGVKRQVISQNRYGIPGTAEAGDRFGSDLTAADLDGDGYTDLVVGSPGEDVGGARDVGRRTVLWGSVGGLVAAAVVGEGRAATRAGDFDGDGHLDLATAYETRYGPISRTGVPARTGPLVDLDVRVYAMAAGDVDGDGRTDLVVSSGSWDSDDGGTVPPPRLQLLRGTKDGLVAGPLIAAADTVSADSIALGDVDHDGHQDVVFGRSTATGGGLVGVVRGTADGFAARATLIGQDTPGVPGTGRAATASAPTSPSAMSPVTDTPTSSPGCPARTTPDGPTAGTFAVLRGSRTGLSGSAVQVFSQNTAGVPGTAESGDAFGGRTAVVGGHVVVSAPKENAGSGGVWVFAGTASGITATGSVSYGPHTLAAPESGAQLGAAFQR